MLCCKNGIYDSNQYMSEQLNNGTRFSKTQQSFGYHFWTLAYPFFTGRIVVGVVDKLVSGEANIKAYDPDGGLAYNKDITLSEQGALEVAFSDVLANVKLESGIKHSYITVNSRINSLYASCSFMNDKDSELNLPQLVTVPFEQPIILPVSLDPSVQTLIALVNISSIPAYAGIIKINEADSKEVVKIIPPYGNRILSLEEEIFTNKDGASEVQYLKFRTKRPDAQLGIMIFEQYLHDGNFIYQFIGS